MEHEAHSEYFNLMPAETLPQSGYYFYSQDRNVKSCIFHSQTEGYEILKKMNEELNLLPETLLYLLRKLIKSKVPVFTVSDEDFYINTEKLNTFSIEITEFYHRTQGFLSFTEGNFQPLLIENEHACSLKADLYFLPQNAFTANGKIIPVIKEFSSKEKLLNWLSSDEANLHIGSCEINRLLLQIPFLKIEEFSRLEDDVDLSFMPIVFGQRVCLN